MNFLSRLINRKDLLPTTRRKAVRRPFRKQLSVELLEDRVVPATITYVWTNADHNGSWADNANWTNGGPSTVGANTAILEFDAGTAAATAANVTNAGQMVDDLSNPYAVSEIHFANTGGATSVGYSIVGTNTLSLGSGGIVVDSGFGTGDTPVTFGSGITTNLTANSVITESDGNTIATLNGAVGLGGNKLTVVGANLVTLNGIVSGAGAAFGNAIVLTSGTLELNGANTYTTGFLGSTTTVVNGGQLIVGNNSGLGAAANTESVTGAAQIALINTVSPTMTGTLTLNNGALFAYGTASTWTGPIALTNGTANSISANNGGTLVINGAISGGNTSTSLNINGLNGPNTTEFAVNNTYSGTTVVSSGDILQIDAPGGLGAGGAANTGTTVNNGGELLLDFTSGNPLAASGGTGAAELLTLAGTGPNGLGALQVDGAASPIVNGTIALTADTTIGVGTGDLTLGGTAVVSGGFNLSYDQDAGGDGEIISSAVNTYTGNTDIGTGVTLTASNSAVFGPNAAATATIENGASLQLSGGITIAQNIFLNALAGQTTGPVAFSAASGATGQIDSVSGTNILNGVITLNDAVGTQNVISVDAGTLTLNATAIQGPGGIAGQGGGIIKAGAGRLFENGGVANTYGGLTTVIDGLLELNKAANVIAVPGALIIGDNSPNTVLLPIVKDSDVVQIDANNEIGTSVPITINADGELFLNGFLQTTGPLTITGGDIVGPGTLTLNGDVTATSFINANGNLDQASITAGTINLNIAFGGGTRTFNVAATLPAGHTGQAGGFLADLFTDSVFTDGSGTPVNLKKTGTGEMSLSANNTYTGTTEVANGILFTDFTTTAFGVGPAAVTVDSGASIGLNNSSVSKPLFLNGVGFGGLPELFVTFGGTGTWSGVITLGGSAASTVGALTGNTLILSNQITGGTNGLTVMGGGLTTETNGTGTNRNNNYGGVTTVAAGTTLDLDRQSTAGFTPALIAVPGDLDTFGTVNVELGFALPNSGPSYEIATTSTVTVEATGILNIGDAPAQQTIAALNGVAGGVVNMTSDPTDQLTVTGAIGVTGAGTFAVNGDGTAEDQFVTNGNAISVAGGAKLNFNVGLTGGGFTQTGGEIDLTGTAQNFQGNTNVNSGVLVLDKTAAVSADAGSAIDAGSVLTIGNGSGAPGAAVVRDVVGFQIGGNAVGGGGASLVVNTDGVFNLNGEEDRLSGATALTMTGGQVQLGSGGTLDLDGNVLVNAGPTATITGTSILALTGLNLDGTTRTFTVATGANLVVSDLVEDNVGGAGLIKTGGGTMTMTGNNTYPGPTSVTGGKLFINGDQPQSAVTVTGAGSTLGGTGTVGGITVGSGAHLAPGTSSGGPGILTAVGDVALNAGSNLDISLNGTTQGIGYSVLSVNGTVTVSPTTNLNVTVNGAFPANTSFVVITANTVTPNPAVFANEVGGRIQSLNDGTLQVVANGTTVTLTTVAATTTLSVTASPLNPFFEQPVTLTAVLLFPAGTVSPGGTVQFFDNGTPIGTAQSVSAAYNAGSHSATLQIVVPSFSVGGVHQITAIYSGDTNNAGTNSPLTANDLVMVQQAPTQATITSPTSPVSVFFGQPITVSATVGVTGGSGTPIGPTGFVDFQATNTVTHAVTDEGDFALNGTSASTTVSNLPAGTYTFTATYLGDGNFSASAASASSAVASVNAANTTNVVVASSNPGAVGSPVTYTVTVTNTSDAVPPAGPVELFDGATDLGAATFVGTNGNTSTYTASFSLGAGIHSITAKYNLTGTENPNFVGSVSSNTVTEVIQPPVSAVVLNTNGSVSTTGPVGGVQPLSTNPGPGAVSQVSSVTDASGQVVTYAISQIGANLWEHTSSGWTEVSGGVFSQVSAATSASGQAVVYGIIGNEGNQFTGTLWELSTAGWYEVSSGSFKQVSAVGTSAGEVVYGILTNGNLWRNDIALNPGHAINVGWNQMSSGQFAQISAGKNSSGNPIVFAVLTNTNLWVQNQGSGAIPAIDTDFTELSNVSIFPNSFTQVVSEQNSTDGTWFAIAADGTIFEHGPAGNTHLAALSHPVTQISATKTPAGTDLLFATLSDGELWEFQGGTGANPAGFTEIAAAGVAATTAP